MAAVAPIPAPSRRRILVIGEGRLIDVVRRALDDAGADVLHLRSPSDRDIRRRLTADVDAVVVISRDDRVSLRLALVVEGLRPGVRLIVTIYNRDLGAQVRRAVRNVLVTSMADVVAAALAGPCIDARLLAVARTPQGLRGVEAGPDGPRFAPLPSRATGIGTRLRANVATLLRPFELSAKTLLAGLLGIVALLLADVVVVAVTLHEPALDAVYLAVRAMVTIGPNTAIDHGPGWLKLYAAATMVAGLACTAIFTAGLVNRMMDRRLVAIVGRRSMPRRDHVVVVGLGQVGLRLCLMIRELGIPVVAVERDAQADNVARAKRYGIPVVIGGGGSRGVLSRLRFTHARALAAVTSDEIENISTSVAGLSIREDLRTLLRAGSGEVTDETRALFRIGVVRDVYRIGGTLLAAAALGSEALEAFADDGTVFFVMPDGAIERFDAFAATVRGAAAAAD